MVIGSEDFLPVELSAKKFRFYRILNVCNVQYIFTSSCPQPVYQIRIKSADRVQL